MSNIRHLILANLSYTPFMNLKGIGKIRWFEDRTVQRQGENGTYSETVRDEFWAEEEYFSMENGIFHLI